LGIKEDELEDLESAILEAKQKYGISGVVTGAVESIISI
jgi:diphthamide synthase (EF-2-diphthine--ammonia ligase)